MAYSADFRECVLENIKNGMKWEDACRIFNVCKDSIGKWKKMQESGSLADVARKEYKPKKIDKQKLIKVIESNPDATLEEISKEFDCWGQSVHKRLVKMGVTRKKNHAISRKK